MWIKNGLIFTCNNTTEWNTESFGCIVKNGFRKTVKHNIFSFTKFICVIYYFASHVVYMPKGRCGVLKRQIEPAVSDRTDPHHPLVSQSEKGIRVVGLAVDYTLGNDSARWTRLRGAEPVEGSDLRTWRPVEIVNRSVQRSKTCFC